MSSRALLALIDDLERSTPEVHSLMVLRHGAVLAEGWWAPFAADRAHQLFSLSKSFTSTAAGHDSDPSDAVFAAPVAPDERAAFETYREDAPALRGW